MIAAENFLSTYNSALEATIQRCQPWLPSTEVLAFSDLASQQGETNGSLYRRLAEAGKTEAKLIELILAGAKAPHEAEPYWSAFFRAYDREACNDETWCR